tara:strand:- start:6939 stop:8021 length:1083 start_codon:yes stop_codon:yes gene_type:complete
MIKIAQLASYDANVGDNIATLNIRKKINELFDNQVEWESVNILNFFDARHNIGFCKSKFKKISEDNDMLIVGGGGLIEGDYKYETRFKLPFNEEILSVIKIPIVSFGIGVNYFRSRKRSQISPEGLKNLKSFIDRCELFSVRNDGSHEILMNFFNDSKIQEVPDPGLIFGFEMGQKEDIVDGFFQPAWNGGEDIIKGRDLNDMNLDKISKIVEHYNLKVIPHCSKDYRFPLNKDLFHWTQEQFSELVKYENFIKLFQTYYDFDFSVAMRGHSQLCAIGLNLPSIYFSTQDKLLNFSKKNNFMEYNVDIKEEHWNLKLAEKINKLKNDKNYLKEWYNIRDVNMHNYKAQFNTFSEKIKKLL